MMYMEDAVNATIQLMEANPENIKIRTSYNLSAIDVTPKEIANEIKKRIPDFTLDYVPDSRQQIADSWPSSIDDSEARKDWNWKHEFDLQRMTFKMLESLKNTL